MARKREPSLAVLFAALFAGLCLFTPVFAVCAEGASKQPSLERNRAQAKTSGPKTNRSKVKKSRNAKLRAERLGLGTRAAASKLLIGDLDPRWIKAARPGKAPRRLTLPVPRGYWGRGFGEGHNGGHLAVDLSGEMRANIVAAAEGLVAYADDGVKGYGKLVLIVHPGGWVTLYAHNDELLVEPGQKVSRGDRIAKLGQTGIARGPHLHFALVANRQHCDPLPLFRPAPKWRSGKKLARLKPGSEKKPLQCRPPDYGHRGQAQEDPMLSADAEDEAQNLTRKNELSIAP